MPRRSPSRHGDFTFRKPPVPSGWRVSVTQRSSLYSMKWSPSSDVPRYFRAVTGSGIPIRFGRADGIGVPVFHTEKEQRCDERRNKGPEKGVQRPTGRG